MRQSPQPGSLLCVFVSVPESEKDGPLVTLLALGRLP